MKTVERIEYLPWTQLREPLKVVSEGLLQIAKDTPLAGITINVRLEDSYFPDKNKNYNLVILTDEELNRLEGKTGLNSEEVKEKSNTLKDIKYLEEAGWLR